MASQNEIQMCKDDVWIVPIDERCDECGDNTAGPLATHVIMLDVRSAGTQIQFGEGRYCEGCAGEIAERIKEALPTCADDEST